jgi:uncharacterized membrane protein
MQKRNFTVLLAALLLSAISCTKDNGENNQNPGGGNDNAGPLFSAARTVVQTNCATAGCHAGSNPQNNINFGDNGTIVAQKDRIKIRAVDNAGTALQMPVPPRAALSAADQKKITDWIGAGGRMSD